MLSSGAWYLVIFVLADPYVFLQHLTGFVDLLDVDDVILGVYSVTVLIEGDLTREAVLEHLFQDVPARGQGESLFMHNKANQVFFHDSLHLTSSMVFLFLKAG